MLETKTFFARADVSTVATLYRDFFQAVAPWTDRLELCSLGWGPAEIRELLVALPSFTRLVVLDLSRNGIGVEGGQLLAGWLVDNGSLTQLDLSENQLCGVNRYLGGTYDATGIKAIADALRLNNSLTALDLRGNYFGVEGAKALAPAIAAIATTGSYHGWAGGTGKRPYG